MTDDILTVGAGGPPPEEDIADGVYPATLTDIKAPRTMTANQGPNKGESFTLRDWVFAIEAPGTPLHERLIYGSTSLANGPKSKQFAYLTALLGGIPPQPKQQFTKSDLVGKPVLITVNHNDGGWPQIANIGALPASMRNGAQPAAQAPQPVAAASSQQPSGDNVPF